MYEMCRLPGLLIGSVDFENKTVLCCNVDYCGRDVPSVNVMVLENQ